MIKEKIRVGIVGYGNLGKGVETALRQSDDMELITIFTRRDPSSLKGVGEKSVVRSIEEIDRFREQIDVLILCGGSKNDLPSQGPMLAAMFNTVDSFDTHAKIPEYFEEIDCASKSAGTVAIISTGWDPGIFSLHRLLGESIVPNGKTYTFWGSGVSQGHSDAIRQIPGVKAAVQYTKPVPEAVEEVRSGKFPELSSRERHRRECYVVLEPEADPTTIEQTIVTMPDYFADSETIVHFISEEELKRNHSAMPHGGFVIRSGKSGSDNLQTVEFSLKLESNPEFTASVLVAYARAAARLRRSGKKGAHTVFDIPPALLSPKSAAELRKELL